MENTVGTWKYKESPAKTREEEFITALLPKEVDGCSKGDHASVMLSGCRIDSLLQLFRGDERLEM